MSEEQLEQEDSMEDILSSIRNILTDEGGAQEEAKPETVEVKVEEKIEKEEATPKKEERVVDSIDDSVVEMNNKQVSSENILELSDNMIVKNEENLISEKIVDESANKISGMAKSIVAEKQIALGDSAVTLEAITKDLLNPLVKDWLEKNLPAIVERVVSNEVERVIAKVNR